MPDILDILLVLLAATFLGKAAVLLVRIPLTIVRMNPLSTPSFKRDIFNVVAVGTILFLIVSHSLRRLRLSLLPTRELIQ
jgi:hypothetical protein